MSIIRFSGRSLIKCKFSILLLCWLLTSCQGSSLSDEQSEPVVSRLDTKLTLNNAVLEQANLEAQTLWKIKAENIKYSEDQQTADLNQVVGNLWKNQEIILKISAAQGVILEEGNIIQLRGSIMVFDPRNDSTFSSEAAEWRPQENLLLIQQQLQGNNPQLEVVADSGIYLTDQEHLTLQGSVSAQLEQPILKISSDRLEWNIPQQQITSPQSLNVVRLNQGQTVTDKLLSDQGEIDLSTQEVRLKNNVELIASEPELQIATNYLLWNYQERTGQTNQPLQILDRKDLIRLTGNQGKFDLSQQKLDLSHGVKGINQSQQSELYAQQLQWQLDNSELTAEGNVIFEQKSPPLRLMGDRAQGTLKNNNIVVSSQSKNQVTSVINN